MAKTDWKLNDVIQPSDMNQIGQEINEKETPEGAQEKVNEHENRTDNPHSVTHSQVGLGNVQNFSIATQTEAEAGAAANKYMTPERTKQAVDKFTESHSRKVMETMLGGVSTENGTNTWAKIGDILFPPPSNRDASIVLSISFGGHTIANIGNCLIAISARQSSTSPNMDMSVQILALAQNGNTSIRDDSFKLVSDGAGKPVSLWVKKYQTYVQCTVYEVSKILSSDVFVTYNDNAPWQSEEPTGVYSAVSNGLTYRDLRVVHEGFKATQAQAEAGTDHTNYMTPKTTKEAIEKLSIGTSNKDIVKEKALVLKTDTRTITLTYDGENLTKVEEKDDATVVKTTNLSYDTDGDLITTEEIAGGSTVTSTLSYTDGKLSSVSKVVT
ncbi:hypothetical protein [Caldalkalibacillus mannanilyticus]|uniref:hypothetical protein n=1 Tax=Caldalkalibacillus mannanilyticus TaxID=1418 RepID=UPI00046A5752|nr:hypothetical protein [Caldalkalibacillus mannanilyticus]